MVGNSNISYFRGRNHNDDGRGNQRSFLEGSCEKPHMSNVFEGLRQLGEWGQHHPSYLLAGVGGGLALMGVTWFWRNGSALIGDPKNGENYHATHAARRQYGRVEAFAPYARPPCCINVEDT